MENLVNHGLRLRSLTRMLFREKTLLFVFLTMSVILNISLSQKVMKTQEEIDLYRTNIRISVGDSVSVLKSHDENGNELSLPLEYRSLPTLMYFHSATCHWCKQNLENLKGLAVQANGRYHLVTVLAEPAERAPNLVSLPGAQALYDPLEESRIKFGLVATPTTILISQEGKVDRIWRGAYKEEMKSEIEHTLGIHLPGLVDSISK